MTDGKKSAVQRVLAACLAAIVLAASLGAVETLAQRRRRVEEMSAEQRDELLRNEQQFRALAPQEQQRIRDLYEQIENAPDRDALRATMNRYCKWLEAQPPFRRARLLDKKTTVKQRVATVKEFLARPGPTKDLHLDDKNRRVLAAWLDRYTAENGARFMESLGPMFGPGVTKLPPDRQQAVLREMLLRRWQKGGPGGQLPIAEAEMARLRAGLSPDLRSWLEKKKPAEQARMVAEWLRETASHELDEQLANFFESSSISDEERDRLMSLPADEMYDSLSKQYRAHVLKQSKAVEPPRRTDQPPRSDRPPWLRGGHRQTPSASGTQARPEDRGDKEPRPAKDSKGSK